MTKTPFFLVRHLSAGYGTCRILHDVSFSLKAGMMTALLGTNGSGKTTLLKALCRQIPSTGDAFLQETSLASMTLRQRSRHISYIPQQSGIRISLPVLDVVMMGFNPWLGLLKHPSEAQKTEARMALERMGLSALEAADYLTLSEGQKQLCILARTLIEHTSLLLLDEPESALDFYQRRKILCQLSQLVSQKEKAALLCLHDPQLALEFCDQLLILKDGRIVHALYPHQDSAEKMESALQELYGPLSITFCSGPRGEKRPVILSDILKGETTCSQ